MRCTKRDQEPKTDPSWSPDNWRWYLRERESTKPGVCTRYRPPICKKTLERKTIRLVAKKQAVIGRMFLNVALYLVRPSEHYSEVRE